MTVDVTRPAGGPYSIAINKARLVADSKIAVWPCDNKTVPMVGDVCAEYAPVKRAKPDPAAKLDPNRNAGRECICGADLSEPGSRMHHSCQYTNREPAAKWVPKSGDTVWVVDGADRSRARVVEVVGTWVDVAFGRAQDYEAVRVHVDVLEPVL